jgi:hypothetical protein
MLQNFFVRNLRILIISLSVCFWQALFCSLSNTLAMYEIPKLRTKKIVITLAPEHIYSKGKMIFRSFANTGPVDVHRSQPIKFF